MVNQAKLRDLPGDVLTNWNQTGVLSMIFAHLHSLELTRDIFLRQVRLGEASAEVPALA
ncbi:hypothetical protein D9M72_609940 [compost metagenome]